MTRAEIIKETQIADGALLTKALKELIECGFIRKYRNVTQEENGMYFQIIDPFTLYYFSFLGKNKINSWTKYIGTPSYNSWSGLAFEMVCLNHVPQIKAALGITGVDSTEYAWRSLKSAPGAQIDLVIDRMDNVVNLSEIKYTAGEFTIDDAYAANLRNKIEVFRKETKTKKAVHLTFISVNGLARTGRSSVVVNEVTGEDLFG